MDKSEQYYTYILRCKDDTLYTGYTDHITRRVEVHNAGKGAKYTRCRLPVTLAYVEAYQTKREAQSREVKIKQLPRMEKLRMIADWDGTY